MIVASTYITSKLWFVRSDLLISNKYLGNITLGKLSSFIWSKGGSRISLRELAMRKEKGELNLLIPEAKLKSLLINRLTFRDCKIYQQRIV